MFEKTVMSTNRMLCAADFKSPMAQELPSKALILRCLSEKLHMRLNEVAIVDMKS
jgi:hypothetical protein